MHPLCDGFAARLKPCRANEGLSISNQLLKSQTAGHELIFPATRVYAPLLALEDEQGFMTIDGQKIMSRSKISVTEPL
jgi:hypothetical protein